MLGVTSRGNYNKTDSFLKKLLTGDIYSNFNRYGQLGIDALSQSTPIESGLTSSSWGYRIIKNRRHPGIEWFNTNVASGTPVAILIQYGHGTGTGGYVSGRDYINPAMRSIFDNIANDIWKKVIS